MCVLRGVKATFPCAKILSLKAESIRDEIELAADKAAKNVAAGAGVRERAAEISFHRQTSKV